jgi:predicted RNase H-like nuclease (RuvC/YqgF family)
MEGNNLYITFGSILFTAVCAAIATRWGKRMEVVRDDRRKARETEEKLSIAEKKQAESVIRAWESYSTRLEERLKSLEKWCDELRVEKDKLWAEIDKGDRGARTQAAKIAAQAAEISDLKSQNAALTKQIATLQSKLDGIAISNGQLTPPL